MIAGYNLGVEPVGRELLVVVVKGTFGFPQPGRIAQLHRRAAAAGHGRHLHRRARASPRRSQEVDFAPRKPRCDVLLIGQCLGAAWASRPSACRSACGSAPGRRSSRWSAIASGMRARRASRASRPRPSSQMPISYDCAFGGVDASHEDPARARRLHAQSGRSRLAPAPAGDVCRRHAAAQHRGAERPGRRAPDGRLRADGLRAAGAGLGHRACPSPAPTTRTGSTTSSRSCRRTSTTRTTRPRPRTSRSRYPAGAAGGGAAPTSRPRGCARFSAARAASCR